MLILLFAFLSNITLYFPSLKQYHLIKRRVPSFLFYHLAKLSGNEQTKKNALRYKKVVAKGEEVGKSFKHFISHEWVFTSKKSEPFRNFLSQEEKSLFNLEVEGVKWQEYLSLFAWVSVCIRGFNMMGKSKKRIKENPMLNSQLYWFVL